MNTFLETMFFGITLSILSFFIELFIGYIDSKLEDRIDRKVNTFWKKSKNV